MKKVFMLLGIFFILGGIVCNPILVSKHLNNGSPLQYNEKVCIIIIELILIIFGALYLLLKNDIVKVNISITVISTIISLFCVEGILNYMAFYNEKYDSIKAYDLYSCEYHHDYKPKVTFIRKPTKLDEFKPIKVSINSMAIRGPEIQEKKADEYRILLLGDSFIQADEIEYDKTIGQVLNRILKEENAKIDNKSPFVIQHGMSSWSPLLELNWLNKKGLLFKPDHVILFLCINDFYSFETYPSADIGYTESAVFNNEGYPNSFNRVTPSVNSTVPNNKSKFEKIKEMQIIKLFNKNKTEGIYETNKKPISQEDINYLLTVDKNILSEEFDRIICDKEDTIDVHLKNIIRLSRDFNKWDEKTIQEVNISLDYLSKIKMLLEKNHIQFSVTIVPLPWNISKDENIKGRGMYRLQDAVLPMDGIKKKIMSFCEENKIAYIDLNAAFRNYSKLKNEKLFLQYDGHWSPKGHFVAAEAVYDILMEKK